MTVSPIKTEKGEDEQTGRRRDLFLFSNDDTGTVRIERDIVIDISTIRHCAGNTLPKKMLKWLARRFLTFSLQPATANKNNEVESSSRGCRE